MGVFLFYFKASSEHMLRGEMEGKDCSSITFFSSTHMNEALDSSSSSSSSSSSLCFLTPFASVALPFSLYFIPSLCIFPISFLILRWWHPDGSTLGRFCCIFILYFYILYYIRHTHTPLYLYIFFFLFPLSFSFFLKKN